MASPVKIDRYPGLRPFDEQEKAMFFGRTTETQELSQYVNVYDLFVLHGESGLGKSSLINAGLIPLLKEQGYLPILIRLKDRDETPLSQVAAQLQKNAPALPANAVIPESLRQWVKWLNWNKLQPVLIFDQFEEFAYYKSEFRLPLIEALSALQTPVTVTGTGESLFKEGEESDFSWHSQPLVKMIFSLRSDRLSLLEEFSVQMPSMLRTRYPLKPVLLSQAEQIIVIPAVLDDQDGLGFNTRPFQLQPELIQNIIEVVKDSKRNTIGTTQLQMICQEMEQTIKARQEKSGEPITLTTNDLSTEKLRELVTNFYNKQLAKLREDPQISKVEFAATRQLIERRLLIQKKRVPLPEASVFQFYADVLKEKYQTIISDEKIRYIKDSLLNLRLIRDQTYGDAVFYEISHDTLIEPIEKERLVMEEGEAKERQRKKEKQEDAEKKRQEDEINRQKEHISQIEAEKARADGALQIANHALQIASNRRRWVLAIGASLLCFVFFAFLYYKQQNEKTGGLLAQIYVNLAEQNYQLGDQQLAYRYWEMVDSIIQIDSVKEILKTRSFAAFAGSDMEVSPDLQTVAARYVDNSWHLWKLSDSDQYKKDTDYLTPNFVQLFLGKGRYLVNDTLHYALYDAATLAKMKSDLDIVVVAKVVNIQDIGNYLQIVQGDDNGYRLNFFSLRTGRSLPTVTRILSSIKDLERPGSGDWVPAAADSSVVRMYLTGNNYRYDYLIDLAGDTAVRLNSHNWTNSIAYNKDIGYQTSMSPGRLFFYSMQTDDTASRPIPKNDIPFHFVNKGTRVLLKRSIPFKSGFYDILSICDRGKGPLTAIDTLAYEYDPDFLKGDSLIIYISSEKELCIYDCKNMRPVGKFANAGGYTLSPDNSRVFIHPDSGAPSLADTRTLKKIRTFGPSEFPVFYQGGSFYIKHGDTVSIYGKTADTPSIRFISSQDQGYYLQQYGDTFVKTRDLQHRMTLLNFLDSSKRNQAFLKPYFAPYLDEKLKKAIR